MMWQSTPMIQSKDHLNFKVTYRFIASSKSSMGYMTLRKKNSKPSKVNEYKNKIRLLISRDHSPVFRQHLGILG